MSKYKPITITPKEKALQIVESVGFSTSKVYEVATGEYKSVYSNPKWKESALAVVGEIFHFMKDDDDESETCYWANHPKATFWVEVEQEIKNM
jgi:hypothetical protein